MHKVREDGWISVVELRWLEDWPARGCTTNSLSILTNHRQSSPGIWRATVGSGLIGIIQGSHLFESHKLGSPRRQKNEWTGLMGTKCKLYLSELQRAFGWITKCACLYKTCICWEIGPESHLETCWSRPGDRAPVEWVSRPNGHWPTTKRGQSEIAGQARWFLIGSGQIVSTHGRSFISPSAVKWGDVTVSQNWKELQKHVPHSLQHDLHSF